MILDEFAKCKTDVNLKGKVALVVGGSAGLGFETAKDFARRGAKVIIASRNQQKLENSRNSIVKSTKNINVVSRSVNFESFDSIRNFASKTITAETRLDIFVNTVGAIGLEDRLTADNAHLMMQVNYFGLFLLTYLLIPLLKKSAPSRTVDVASSAILLGDIDFDHMNDVGKYSSFGFYSNAKLASVLFNIELDKRIKNSGVSVYSMDPGIMKTKFFRNFNNSAVRNFFNSALYKFGRPVKRAATMPVFLAIDPRVENKSGKYFRDCENFYSSWFADDENLREKLWSTSKKIVKITDEEDWET